MYVSTAVKENTLFLLTAALRFPSLLLARTLACYDEPWRRRAQEEGLRRPGQVDGDVEVAVRPSPSRLLLVVFIIQLLFNCCRGGTIRDPISAVCTYVFIQPTRV